MNQSSEEKILSAIGYLGILFLVPLLVKRDSSFAQFHACQGFVLFLIGIAIWIGSIIPYLGWFLIAPLGSIFWLVLMIIGIVNVLTGKTNPLPLTGELAEKIKI